MEKILALCLFAICAASSTQVRCMDNLINGLSRLPPKEVHTMSANIRVSEPKNTVENICQFTKDCTTVCCTGVPLVFQLWKGSNKSKVK